MTEDLESGKVGICAMKDLRDQVQVGIAMEIFRKNGVRYVNITKLGLRTSRI